MIETEHSKVYFGSNLDVLPTLEDNSVDSIVTDPPYELGFMGKSWDSSGIAYNVELWKECLRVLKPGGHLLSFGGTRTWHRVAVAIEDAGFEVRDSIAWMYGSGFPKSLDVSKAIDKAAGADREVLTETVEDLFGEREEQKKTIRMNEASGLVSVGQGERTEYTRLETAPSTPEAQQWEGWGTALKPAFEPIVVARKPLIGTVAQNVLEHGTGGLNIDGSRIGTTVETWPKSRMYGGKSQVSFTSSQETIAAQPTAEAPSGRWPANVILDEYSAEILDGQSGVGVSKSGGKSGTHPGPMDWGKENKDIPRGGFDDSGGASRFFYCAKASKTDRNEGLEELEGKANRINAPRASEQEKHSTEKQNFHPTVKPTALMTYLINLVTPPNGTVLDPFTGSGSTGKAAILAGFNFIGIELTEDYYPIIEGRLKHAEAKLTEAKEKEGEALF